MKKILMTLTGIIISSLMYSCMDKTCTSLYLADLKIDGKKEEKISIKYIGPKKNNYENEFRFYSSEYKLPFFKSGETMTNCYSRDFKNQNYDFLEIQNLGTEDIIICGVLQGAEIDEFPNSSRYSLLLEIYGKQDLDPNYDYTKDNYYAEAKSYYVERNILYEQLLKENYPYIIRLEPQKKCIMKWNNLGFKIL